MIKYKIIIFSFFLILSNCSSKNDPNNEKVIIEADPNKKAREYADKGGGIFGDINNKKSATTTYEFASSNVLWRATLKSLEFLPLLNADYSGGIIIYDWYSDNLNSDSQIKITVKFLSNDLRSDSIQITGHKKNCDPNNKCITVKLNNNLPEEIKEKILFTARAMKIEEAKNKKN